MKMYQAATLALLISTSAASACELQRVSATFGMIRAKPSLDAEPLWKLGEGVVLVWCGRTSTDSRGIKWNWVATMWQEELWAHKGWISSRIVERDVPTITRKETPTGYDTTDGATPKTFEEGGD